MLEIIQAAGKLPTGTPVDVPVYVDPSKPSAIQLQRTPASQETLRPVLPHLGDAAAQHSGAVRCATAARQRGRSGARSCAQPLGSRRSEGSGGTADRRQVQRTQGQRTYRPGRQHGQKAPLVQAGAAVWSPRVDAALAELQAAQEAQSAWSEAQSKSCDRSSSPSISLFEACGSNLSVDRRPRSSNCTG